VNRPLIAVVGASAASVLALWLVPPVGFVAVMVLLVLIPPWGRSLSERAVISALMLMGVVAVVFPRAGGTPVTAESARLTLTALVIFVLALRAVPAWRTIVIPKPSVADFLVLLLGVVSSVWLMTAYIGRNAFEMVSGLFFSGWDNQAHFTTFANTYEVASTTWPTVDGSIAWNQWYPSLHTTLWSLAELGSHSSSAALDRIGLLWPYIQWSAISFGLCLAALAWVAGDLAARIGGRANRTRPMAVGLVALFGLLGSPAFLFNKGFTNFMMGVTVAVVVAYISARSWRSARELGWFLIPLGALIIIGLWTPLVLGLVPSGVVVAIALLKYRRLLGIVWLVGTAALGAFMVLTQSQAILGVEPGQSTADFTTSLGAVGTGMAAFNIGAALAAPIVACFLVALLVRRRRWPLPAAVAGPVLGAGIVAIVFALGADAADVGRLQSYYVLKCLDAMLLASAPLIAAVLAVAAVRALRGVNSVNSVLAVCLGCVVAIAMFGYVGARPVAVDEGFWAAPGIQAGADRTQGVNDPLVGEAIIRGTEAAVPYPDYTTLLWDGAGTLPNLWVSSLSGVMSKDQNTFYRGLPSFPYDDKAAQYVSFAMNLDADLRVVVLWFRQPSGDLLRLYVQERGDDRVQLVQVPMPSNLLCPECTG
jgi:hypothetical protein